MISACRCAPGCAPPVPPQASRSPAFYPPHHSAHRGPQFHQGPKTSGRVVSPPSGLGVGNGYDSSSSSGSAHSHNRGKPDAHSRLDQGTRSPLQSRRSPSCPDKSCACPNPLTDLRSSDVSAGGGGMSPLLQSLAGSATHPTHASAGTSAQPQQPVFPIPQESRRDHPSRKL